MLENLHHTKELGRRTYDLIRSGDLEAYGELMHDHWEHKRRRSPGMSDERIDRLYTLARRSGCIGGKLVGAGGGGFLLLYAANPADVRQAMAAAGVSELTFDFEFGGALRVRADERDPLRVAIAGCGLIGTKRAGALGAATSSSAASTCPARGAGEFAECMERAPARASSSCSISSPRW